MEITTADKILYAPVPKPEYEPIVPATELPKEVYGRRLERVKEMMARQNLDVLVIYADKEHFSNFEYLFGFEPRFEEAVAVLHQNGDCRCLLGNECYPLYTISAIPMEPVLCQLLSMPGQPMDKAYDMQACFREGGIQAGQRIGLIGWKVFPAQAAGSIDVPCFIVDALYALAGKDAVRNRTALFVDPANGLRTVYEWEQAVIFENAATMVSQGMLEAMDAVAPGKTELQIGARMNPCSLPTSSHPNVSSGARTRVGLVSPTAKRIALGDRMTMCWSLRGGLSCRAGYAANSEQDLPAEGRDYLEKIVKPYYASIVTFYENLAIGVTGGELYDAVTRYFPQDEFHWTLNPGHYLGTEEWLSSPVWNGSKAEFRSGQFVQADLIPAPDEPYFGCNVEDGILIADAELRGKLQQNAPESWARIQRRRRYMGEALGITLREEVLPLYDSQGYLRPFLLRHTHAMRKA